VSAPNTSDQRSKDRNKGLPTKQDVLEALKPVKDPEIQIGIVDLGLVYDVDISRDGIVQIKMTLTTPACPYGEMLVNLAHRAVQKLDGVAEVRIALVWEPVWDPKEMASEEAKDILGIW
jgi:metal-sulfur cluster biosynthetic enzyme